MYGVNSVSLWSQVETETLLMLNYAISILYHTFEGMCTTTSTLEKKQKIMDDK